MSNPKELKDWLDEFRIEGSPLRDYQKETILEWHTSKKYVLKAARQLGTTTMVLASALYDASVLNKQVVIIFPKEAMARDAADKLRDASADWTVCSKERLRLVSGGLIDFRIASSNSCRGMGYDSYYLTDWDIVKNKQEFWRSVIPTISYSRTRKLIVSGTPLSKLQSTVMSKWGIEPAEDTDGPYLCDLQSPTFTVKTLTWKVHPEWDQKWKDEMINMIGKDGEEIFDCEFECKYGIVPDVL